MTERVWTCRVAEEQGIDPTKVALKVGRMRWVCDGCDAERPDDHDDWAKRDGRDYCPACQKANPS